MEQTYLYCQATANTRYTRFEVQQEGFRLKCKLLHRNTLLPFSGLPCPEEIQRERLSSPTITPVSDDEDYYESSSESSTEESRTENNDEIADVPEKNPERKEHKIPNVSIPCDTGHISDPTPRGQGDETESEGSLIACARASGKYISHL